MKVTIDTKEDTHEEIRKAIKMLQHIIGDDQAIPPMVSEVPSPAQMFSNSMQGQLQDPQEQESTISSLMQDSTITAAVASQIQPVSAEEKQDSSSTEDLFAELFSEEEIQKMDSKPVHEVEEEPKQTKSPYKIEIY